MEIFRKTLIFVLAITFALGLIGPVSMASAATSPNLGAAGSYSVLGHTTVTNTGGTTMPGDLGISIGGSPVGFPPGSVGPPGTIRNAADSLAAQTANTATFLALSAAPNVACSGADYGAVTQDLAGSTLTPGVYCADAFQLTGTLYLDSLGDSDAVWIFRSELSTLDTTPGIGASVQFSNEVSGSPCNVWWKVASSATIGSGTSFIGNILALTSISMGTGATLNGRALAQTGAVTLDTNTFTGASCLTASIFTSSSPTTSPAITPKLPNTGIAPKQNNDTVWNVIIIVGAVITLSTLYLVRKKRII